MALGSMASAAVTIVAAQCLNSAVERLQTLFLEPRRKRKQIRRDLEKSLGDAFQWFESEYPVARDSLFDEFFVENHLKQEIAKLLTRNQSPDAEAVASKAASQLSVASDGDFLEPAQKLFRRVELEMARHESLNEILDSRQIDQIDSGVSALRQQTSDDHAETQEKLDQIISMMSAQQPGSAAGRMQVSGGATAEMDYSNAVPDADNGAFYSLLNKTIDTAKKSLKLGRIEDARTTLVSIEDEVESAGGDVLFRHRTCMASCSLAEGGTDTAAAGFIDAFEIAPESDKAWTNRIHGLLLRDDIAEASSLAETALEKFPQSESVCAIGITVRAKNGQFTSIDEVPESLRSKGPVLHALVYSSIDEGNPGKAFEFARESYEADSSSFDSLSSLIFSALSLELQDELPPPVHELSRKGEPALRFAVSALEDSLPAVEKADMSPLLESILNNGIVSFELLEKREDAVKLARRAIDIGVFTDGVIRVVAEDFQRKDGGDLAAEFFEPKYSKISTDMLLGLLELSAGSGNEKWVADVKNELRGRELGEAQKRDFDLVDLLALRRLQGVESAISAAESLLASSPDRVMLLIILARLKREVDKPADPMLDKLERLAPETSTAERFQIAEILYEFERFESALENYRSIVKPGEAGYIAQKYLACLHNLNARAEAMRFLSSMPIQRRQTVPIQNIEVALLERMGDRAQLIQLLRGAVKRLPGDGFIACKFADYLYLDDQLDELDQLLASDPSFEVTQPKVESEFAGYQIRHGHRYAGFRRLYRLFRNNPTDRFSAGSYWSAIFDPQFRPQSLWTAEKVQPGVTIEAEHNFGTFTLHIDLDPFAGPAPWYELHSPDSDFSKDLQGKVVGDWFQHNGESLKIVGLTHIFSTAVVKARDVVESLPGSAGPIIAIAGKDANAEAAVQETLAFLKRQESEKTQILKRYETTSCPISTLCLQLGWTGVDIFFEWPASSIKKKVSHGGLEELAAQSKMIGEGKQRFTVDLQAILELYFRGIWDQALEALGPLIIPASLVDYLRRALVVLKTSPRRVFPQPLVRENEGYVSHKVEMDQQDRAQMVEGLIKKIEDTCEVVFVTGPEKPLPWHSLISKVLDGPSLDLLLLMKERGLSLLTEDSQFREYAKVTETYSFTRFQSLLDYLCRNGFITHKQYGEIVLKKIADGDTFIHLNANNLVLGAVQSRKSVTQVMGAVLQSVGDPSADLTSTLDVSIRFLQIISRILDPRLVIRYFRLVRDSFSEFRPEQSKDIEWTILVCLMDAIQQLSPGRKIARVYERFFRKLAPVASEKARESLKNTLSNDHRLTTLAIAVKAVNNHIAKYGWP